MASLDEPSPPRRLRKVDPIFVESLKKRLQSDPNGPGIPPIAVTCKNISNKEQFKERLKNVYRYEVNGGLHGVKARQSLLQENASQEQFSSISAIVYIGLTDEEALRLAARHNINGHFNHKMTHRDYVSKSFFVAVLINNYCTCVIKFCTIQLEVCRSRLFAIAGKNLSDDVPAPSIEWKRECGKYILPHVSKA